MLCAADRMTGASLSSSQDILSFISKKGPITKGIFRTSGDRRAFRALKERLDSGTEVNLNNESVPVVASILKVGRVLASAALKNPLKLCESLPSLCLVLRNGKHK